jgi:hypothetical protein
MVTVDPRDEEQMRWPPPHIKWVPLLVPMFALMLAVLVYFIGAEVL